MNRLFDHSNERHNTSPDWRSLGNHSPPSERIQPDKGHGSELFLESNSLTMKKEIEALELMDAIGQESRGDTKSIDAHGLWLWILSRLGDASLKLKHRQKISIHVQLQRGGSSGVLHGVMMMWGLSDEFRCCNEEA
jgi:hypothetical protein